MWSSGAFGSPGELYSTHIHFHGCMWGFSDKTQTHTGSMHISTFQIQVFLKITPTLSPSSICALKQWTDFITETCNYTRLSHNCSYGWQDILMTTKTKCRGQSCLFAGHDLFLDFSGNNLWLHKDDCGATPYLPGLSCTNHQPFNNECEMNVLVRVRVFEVCEKETPQTPAVFVSMSDSLCLCVLFIHQGRHTNRRVLFKCWPQAGQFLWCFTLLQNLI